MEPSSLPAHVPPALHRPGRRLPGRLDAARALIGIALLAGVVFTTVHEWHDVAGTIGKISPQAIVAAFVLTLLGLAASAMTWRCCLDELGARVRVAAAMKIYLVGQLGKYIPGSVWALVVQMDLARRASVRRTLSVGAGLVAIGINLVTGAAIGLLALPLVIEGSPWRYVGAVIGMVACAVALAPPVLGRLADLVLRLIHQPSLDRRPGWSGILKGVALSASSWLAYGLSLGLLAVGAGADPARTFALALPAVAIAMTIGFLVVVAPSGIGVREAVLVAALTPVLEPGAALGVVLVLRFVFTLADVTAALATLPIDLRATPARVGASERTARI